MQGDVFANRDDTLKHVSCCVTLCAAKQLNACPT